MAGSAAATAALGSGAQRPSLPPPAGPEAAPFYADVAEAPEGAHAIWLHADDGVRLRLGLFPHPAPRGTILLMPGRTEFVEKYGRAASMLAERGYATIVVDWRGQGLSDRLGPTPPLGHVRDFLDFQRDVAAVIAALPRVTGPALPMPHTLLAHSMAGAIALRALINGVPQAAGIRCAAFTGPMWDIAFTPGTRPAAALIADIACRVGLGSRFAPGTSGETYVSKAEFEGNTLTTDRDMWNYMRRQITTYPELSLSGPSLQWLHGALREATAFLSSPLPKLPVEVFLGSREEIVSQQAMKALCDRWPSARLRVLDGKQHEVMMEDRATQARIFDAVVAHADQYGATAG